MKKKVKTILLQDINKIGKKYDLKELSRGYAHYLYRNQKVNFYNTETWSEVEKAKELEQKKQLSALAEAQEIKEVSL